MTENPRLVLTKRFTEAVEYARQLHTEYRKGTDIPYMAHLIGVAALVMGEAGGRGPGDRGHGDRRPAARRR